MTATLLILAALVGLGLIWLVKGFFRVAEMQRVVVEWAWGGYWFCAGTGLHWRPKILSRVRDRLDLREQGMPIFDADLWIDLVDGSIRPRSARMVLRIIDPLTYDGPPRPVYAVADWRTEIKPLTETQVSSYLRPLTIKQALQEGQAGFDLAYQINQKRLELGRAVRRLRQEIEATADDAIRRAKESERELLLRGYRNLLGAMREIRKIKQEWGIEVTQIFIPEYDLSPEVLDARNKVQAEERRARAEEHSLRRRVLESAGTYGEIRQMLINQYGYSPDEADVHAKELWEYLRGTEKGSITDVRVQGSGSLLDAVLARLIKPAQMFPDDSPVEEPTASDREDDKKRGRRREPTPEERKVSDAFREKRPLERLRSRRRPRPRRGSA